jgi:DNA invertase Pin-like site-specific DNA recombinase
MTRVGYARVSRVEQHPEAQADALTAAGCDRIFTDHGVSGRQASRPEWDACLAYLRPQDVLVVTKLDRIGRSVRNLIDVVNDLRERKVDLIVLDQGIDTTTPNGKFMFHVLAAVAEFEADLNRERTLDGLAAARARGRVGGRKPKLTDRQARTVRQMYEATGPDGKRKFTVSEIGEAVGVHRTTVYDYLGQQPKPSKAGQ